MSRFDRQRLLPIARFLSLALFLAMSGCGGVDFFPAFVRPPTQPDSFSFTSQAGVALSTPITSKSITVAGLTGSGTTSPISITGPAGSNGKYSINGATATDAAGTVQNGDRITVTQTSSSTPGGSVTSTLTIGNINGTFTTTTQLVSVSAFSTPVLSGAFVQAFATLASLDGVVGTHVISIQDSLNDGNASFSIGDVNGNPTTFSNLTQTISIMNGLRLYVRNLPSATTVTTVTIDGVNFTVTLTAS